jgi:hypothetical protein
VFQRLDERTTRLDRSRYDLCEIDRGRLQLYLASGNARYVEQIIHEPRELPDLPIDYIKTP